LIRRVKLTDKHLLFATGTGRTETPWLLGDSSRNHVLNLLAQAMRYDNQYNEAEAFLIDALPCWDRAGVLTC